MSGGGLCARSSLHRGRRGRGWSLAPLTTPSSCNGRDALKRMSVRESSITTGRSAITAAPAWVSGPVVRPVAPLTFSLQPTLARTRKAFRSGRSSSTDANSASKMRPTRRTPSSARVNSGLDSARRLNWAIARLGPIGRAGTTYGPVCSPRRAERSLIHVGRFFKLSHRGRTRPCTASFCCW